MKLLTQQELDDIQERLNWLADIVEVAEPHAINYLASLRMVIEEMPTIQEVEEWLQ